MDSAGLALQKVCEQLESTEKPSAWAKLGFHRRSARATANEAMLNMAAQDFGDLRRIVQGFESTWKGNQSNVSQWLVQVLLLLMVLIRLALGSEMCATSWKALKAPLPYFHQRLCIHQYCVVVSH